MVNASLKSKMDGKSATPIEYVVLLAMPSIDEGTCTCSHTNAAKTYSPRVRSNVGCIEHEYCRVVGVQGYYVALRGIDVVETDLD